MSNALVSVIIPVYNRSLLLAEAVESVMKQSYNNYEIIIADDASDDSPGTLIDRLSEKYSIPVKWKILPRHSGMPGYVRNKGAEEASGRYLAFLDSDDLWMPEKLKEQVPALENALPDVKICHTRELWVRNGKTVSQSSHKHKREGFIFSDSLWKCIIGPSTVMMEKKLFESFGGFREDLEVAEDYELWLRMTAENPAAYIDMPLTVKRAGSGDQLSEKYGQIEIFRIKALQGLLAKRILSAECAASAGKVFSEKCRIYANGCRKRGRDEEALYYEKLPQSVI